DEAISLFKKANLIAKDIKDTFLLVTTYTNLLLQSIPLEDYASVIQCFNAQIKHDETIQNWNRAMTDYRFLGICYGITGAYAESHKSLTRSLELALKFDNALGIKTVYSSFHELYTRMQEYEKALEYSRLTVAWTDSMHLRTNRVLLTEMQAKYDTEKNEKEIQKLQSEKDINSLKLLVQEESLKRIRVEKDILFTENLFNNTQLNLLANEKELQQCVNEQHEINLQFQQSEIEQKEKEVQILNQESEIKTLALRRQKIVRNFLISGLGMFGLVGFLSYGFYLTRQRLRLQTLRNKIASDLHDDVGSTLSSIYIFSEIAREQSKEVIPMLDTIGESSKKMLDAMADIVWTINPENDDFEKILDRMRSFAYELLGARKIDFKFEAKASLNNIKLPMDVRKNLYLIFKEATNNLVKYSNANTAHFSIKEENKNLTMTITDNGKGFDTQSLSSGNGLKNMKKRAEEIDGKLWIESKREGGTTIKLSVAV
ncbi:MAG TPA: ATP-binding protein, partial [Saprospiraceae bacterium]|nr:ATP-binding protein [Saprospiraceae bacterium]